MTSILYKAIPFDKTLATLALESGVDGILAEPEDVETIQGLGRTRTCTPEDFQIFSLQGKTDEEEAAAALKQGHSVLLEKGWEIIPVENLLAQGSGLAVEVENLDQARLAAGILERGVDSVVVLPEAAPQLKAIVSQLKLSQGVVALQKARVTGISPVGLGNRVCVDTCSLLTTGQGMLVGNSSGFTFLVHAETESNPYVAARPFRINAGAVHSYAMMPGDRTSYLEELAAGMEVLIVDAQGNASLATVGRSKVEVRPMLLITAATDTHQGQVILQNAETIRVVGADAKPVSVVTLREGDEILVHVQESGRHFGMRITEDIKEG